ncbi:protein YBL029W [Kluyveromyces marxianus]|uniref:Protein YBL029W n=1 Tax=Kluyveromyces marxianus TaxID=4911 RepID=A0ABX6F167_KLUMA|nr:protein YBL029W [Kluyveromyces marxianus]
MSWCQENVSDVFSLGYGYGYAYGNGYGYGYGCEQEQEQEQEQGSGSQAEYGVVEPGVVLETEFSYTTLGGLDFGLGDEEVGSSSSSSGGVSGSSFSEPSPAPIPRQRRYSKPQQTTPPPSEGSMTTSSSTSSSPASGAKKVSDSRLSARGLAQVLNLDSPAEALCREKFILDIFEKELHYPLGYKTWVRGTTKEYRAKILYQLHERVKVKYPEYDEKVLETIIRRATYYMMQSRLRRERRAKAKANKQQQQQQQQRGKASSKNKAVVVQQSHSEPEPEPESVPDVTAVSNSDLFIAGEAFLSGDSFLM